ncbi:MAG: MipA/OmpV family protein [Alphaproteobacteria bacterium]|nr:MipA/OmpV family protein [Alphaproteobacteria bacterium]
MRVASTTVRAAAVAAAFFLAGGASAQTKSDWYVQLGIGGIQKPDYPGAEGSNATLWPFFYINWKDIVEADHHDGVRINVYSTRNLKVGLQATTQWPANRPRKLTDVDYPLEVGPYVSFFFDNWKFDVGLRQDILDQHGGYVADFGVTYGAKLRDMPLRFEIQPKLTYVSDDYNQSYHGVTARERTLTGYTRKSPDGGLHDFSLKGKLYYDFTPNWTMEVFMQVIKLMGDAADAQITKDEVNYVTGIGIMYRF